MVGAKTGITLILRVVYRKMGIQEGSWFRVIFIKKGLVLIRFYGSGALFESWEEMTFGWEIFAHGNQVPSL